MIMPLQSTQYNPPEPLSAPPAQTPTARITPPAFGDFSPAPHPALVFIARELFICFKSVQPVFIRNHDLQEYQRRFSVVDFLKGK
jgi:hypothetical protein